MRALLRSATAGWMLAGNAAAVKSCCLHNIVTVIAFRGICGGENPSRDRAVIADGCAGVSEG